MSFEFDKRITENFGFSIGNGYQWLHMPGASTASGWQNLEAGSEKKVYVNPEHEFMLSLGVSREFARTGAIGATGAALDNVGVIAQFQLYFDDLFPNSLGKPIVNWFQ